MTAKIFRIIFIDLDDFLGLMETGGTDLATGVEMEGTSIIFNQFKVFGAILPA
jgi:hypothetical protein